MNWSGSWSLDTADAAYNLIVAAGAGDGEARGQLDAIRQRAGAGDVPSQKIAEMFNSVAKFVVKGLPRPSVVAMGGAEVGATVADPIVHIQVTKKDGKTLTVGMPKSKVAAWMKKNAALKPRIVATPTAPRTGQPARPGQPARTGQPPISPSLRPAQSQQPYGYAQPQQPYGYPQQQQAGYPYAQQPYGYQAQQPYGYAQPQQPYGYQQQPGMYGPPEYFPDDGGGDESSGGGEEYYDDAYVGRVFEATIGRKPTDEEHAQLKERVQQEVGAFWGSKFDVDGKVIVLRADGKQARMMPTEAADYVKKNPGARVVSPAQIAAKGAQAQQQAHQRNVTENAKRNQAAQATQKRVNAVVKSRMLAENRLNERRREQAAAQTEINALQQKLNDAARSAEEQRRLGQQASGYEDEIAKLQTQIDERNQRVQVRQALTEQAATFLTANPGLALPAEMQAVLMAEGVVTVTPEAPPSPEPGDEDIPQASESAPGDVEFNDQ